MTRADWVRSRFAEIHFGLAKGTAVRFLQSLILLSCCGLDLLAKRRHAARVEPARYFVVKPEPLRMTPGLFRLGHDFGNGPVDGLVFQRDRNAERTQRAKEQVLREHPERLRLLVDSASRPLLQTCYHWMVERLEQEHGVQPHRGSSQAQALDQAGRSQPDLARDFEALSLVVQEDFAILQRDEQGNDRLVLLSVCFPSGWEPETLLGCSFAQVHAPIPAFDAIARKRAQMIRAMVERGPYVRFVWTLTADGRLDHHPRYAPRSAWTPDSPGVLRVERQVTVPFSAPGGSLFVIRTHLYPFAELNAEQRSVLAEAVRQMPAEVADYKGLPRQARSIIVNKLNE